MKHLIQKWSISELEKYKDLIDPRPQYQRTPVWTKERKAFLIDSILRGYDIPKIYLKLLGKRNGKDSFEVVDGQQRLRAIWEFIEGQYTLGKDSIFDKENFSGFHYSDLPKPVQKQLKDYVVVVTEIIESAPGEINELFTRLQKGVSLNPPELRHALVSNIGNYVSSFVDKQKSKFFNADCKIEDKRFKHQDYVDHIIALIHYDNTKDLKAAALYQLYVDFLESPTTSFKQYFDDATIVLDAMKKINAHSKGIFKNKWGFVDGYWFLFRNKGKLGKVDFMILAQKLAAFEVERKKHNEKPEKVLENPQITVFGKHLYDYIQAFNKEGANKKNLKIRADVYDKIFKGVFV